MIQDHKPSAIELLRLACGRQSVKISFWIFVARRLPSTCKFYVDLLIYSLNRSVYLEDMTLRLALSDFVSVLDSHPRYLLHLSHTKKRNTTKLSAALSRQRYISE